MKVWQGTKAEVVFHLVGTDKYVGQSFSDIKENASETELIAFGTLLADVTPTDHTLDGVIGTTRVRYYV